MLRTSPSWLPRLPLPRAASAPLSRAAGLALAALLPLALAAAISLAAAELAIFLDELLSWL